MNKVIRILMKRDDMTREEATALVEEVKEMMLEAAHNGDDPEEILMEELGLEPDYMMDILLF